MAVVNGIIVRRGGGYFSPRPIQVCSAFLKYMHIITICLWSDLCLTVFVPYCVKVVELRAYLHSKGAEISEENAAEGPEEDLLQVIAATDIMWKEAISEAG